MPGAGAGAAGAEEALAAALDRLRGELDALGAASAASARPSVETLGGWCDSDFGWGPLVPGGSALTMCFCSTVLELPSAVFFLVRGAQRLRDAMQLPRVKPAFSGRYNLKLLATLTCLALAFTLMVEADPPSVALRVSLSLATLAWCLALVLLVVGYHRHLPQFTCVRVWWVGQFAINLLIFAMHRQLSTFTYIDTLRGGYCVCSILLAMLSLKPMDQPLYSAVVITPPSARPTHSPGVRARAPDVEPATAATPLLLGNGNARPAIMDESYTWGAGGSSGSGAVGGSSRVGDNGTSSSSSHLSRSLPTREQGELRGAAVASSQTPPTRRVVQPVAAAGGRDSQGLEGSPGGESFRGLEDDEDESEDDLGANGETRKKLSRKLSSNLFLSGASKSKFQTALTVWNDTLNGSRAKAWEQEAVSGAQQSAALHSHNERSLLRAAVALDQHDGRADNDNKVGDKDVVDMSGLDVDEDF